MPSSSVLKIDLNVIESNINQIASKGAVMAMVKANAYGTGAHELAPYLEKFGVAMLGVSHVHEGVALREQGVEMPIFVVSVPHFEAHLVAAYRLQPAVSSLEEIEALNAAADEPIPVHLHIDTGMHRFGVAPDKMHSLERAIRQAPNLRFEGVLTHFTSADLPEMDLYTERQISLFKELVAALESPPKWIHAANGPGIRFSLPFCNLMRVGLPLFESALSLESHLVFIDEAKKGESVGYHCAYKVKQTMPIGVIPFGYHDGRHRHYKESGYVIIRGKKAPMIGNICMDFMMVDLSAIPDAKVGERVTLFDPTLPPEQVADWGETDVRELLSTIGPRTKRILIGKEHEQRSTNSTRTLEENSPSGGYLLPA